MMSDDFIGPKLPESLELLHRQTNVPARLNHADLIDNINPEYHDMIQLEKAILEINAVIYAVERRLMLNEPTKSTQLKVQVIDCTTESVIKSISPEETIKLAQKLRPIRKGPLFSRNV